MGHATTITRAELYRLLWTEPTTQVAKGYGLSNVGLAKICKKHNIPRPPRGYWAQRQFGQEPPQTPLPQPNHNPTIEIADRPRWKETDDDTDAAEKIVPIRAGDTLHGCHEFVSRAQGELQSAKTDSDGIIIAADGRTLDIRTTKTHVRRALLIMDAILKECVRRDYPVAIGPTITVLGHPMKLGIHEVVDINQEPEEETDLDKPYEFGHSQLKTIRSITGQLMLSITEGRVLAGRYRSRDTDKHRLEDSLGKAIFWLTKTASITQQQAEDEKRRAEISRQQAAQRQEAERQRAERHKLYKAEKARVEVLYKQAQDFHRSQKIRELIEAVRAAHGANGPIAPDSEIAQWIAWATQQADRLDPLQTKQPSILDEHFEEENPKPTAEWGSAAYQSPKSYWQRNWWDRNQ